MLGCRAPRKRTPAELVRLGTGSWLIMEGNWPLLESGQDLAAHWRATGVLWSACITADEIHAVVHAPSAFMYNILTRV